MSTPSGRDAYRPALPTHSKWASMDEVERTRLALAYLTAAVEHEERHGRLPSVRVGQGLRLAREALASANDDQEAGR